MAVTKNELNRFLKAHPLKEISAARLQYSWLLTKGFDSFAADYIEKAYPADAEDLALEKTVSETESPAELVNFMRKTLRDKTWLLLKERALAREADATPIIRQKCLTNRQDQFIEHALQYFFAAAANPVPWFLENYTAFRSEYLKSLFCLLVGFRGTSDEVPFLMQEVVRYEADFPGEDFEQGPLLALYELEARRKEGTLS